MLISKEGRHRESDGGEDICEASVGWETLIQNSKDGFLNRYRQSRRCVTSKPIKRHLEGRVEG